MSAELQLNFLLQRITPPNINLDNAEECRQFLLMYLEREVSLTGRCQAKFLLLSPASWEEATFPVEEIPRGQEPLVAAMFHRLADRPEVRRAFRVGEVRQGQKSVVTAIERVGERGWWAARDPSAEAGGLTARNG